MTALVLFQTATAVAAGITASFQGAGGTSPYAYAVLPGGAGGTVDPTTGVYTAPAAVPPTAAQATDTVQVTDHVGAKATAAVLVGTPLKLLVDLFQTELSLSSGRVYLWNQKIPQPTDAGLYVALSVPLCKPFGTSKRFDPTTNTSVVSVAMRAVVDIDLISRDSSARDRKEEVLLAIAGDYAERQMAANSFSVSRLSSDFRDLSQVDGAAIPYRYRISVYLTYAVTKAPAADYFSDFSTASIAADDGTTGGGSSAGTPIPDGGGSSPGSAIIDGGSA